MSKDNDFSKELKEAYALWKRETNPTLEEEVEDTVKSIKQYLVQEARNGKKKVSLSFPQSRPAAIQAAVKVLREDGIISKHNQMKPGLTVDFEWFEEEEENI